MQKKHSYEKKNNIVKKMKLGCYFIYFSLSLTLNNAFAYCLGTLN